MLSMYPVYSAKAWRLAVMVKRMSAMPQGAPGDRISMGSQGAHGLSHSAYRQASVDRGDARTSAGQGACARLGRTQSASVWMR